MSVLIKGMDVPKNCDECPIQYKHWGYEIKLCPYSTVDNGADLFLPIDYRMKDCPIYEVPTPHGRLIDADELLKYKTDHEMISTHQIWNAPTVIESED